MKIETIPTRYGAIDVPAAGDDLIVRFLRRCGEWAEDEVRFVAAALPPGARVLDGGAFLGTWSLGLMRETTLSAVVLVEANPAVAPLLRTNIERNRSVPATVLEAVLAPAGAAPRGGSVDPVNLGSFSVALGAEGGREARRVAMQALSLPELAATHGPFDLVKLDVEGMEARLLRDGLAAFDGRTRFWLECAEAPESLELGAVLLATGYDLHLVACPVFAPDNVAGSTEPLYPWAFEAGLWATRGLPPPPPPARGVMRRIETVAALREALWDVPRWAPADWAGLDTPALVARAAHALLGHDPHRFLQQGGAAAGLSDAPLATRLTEARDAAASRAQAAEVMLHVERRRLGEHIAALDGQLAAAATEADALRHEIALRDERLLAADRTILHLDGRSRTLSLVEASTTFRLLAASRAAASRHPLAFRLIRRVLRAVRR